jgi:hypothetical protein
MTTTLPATITDPADANIVTLAFVLENSSAKTNCSKVRLGAPDGTTFELIFDFGYNFSHKSLEMFDVTSFYQTHGKGSYSIEVTTDDGTFSAGCVGTTTTLSDAWLSVSDTTTYGPCCDCYYITCNPGNAYADCCWGAGDWGMSVMLDPAGVTGDGTAGMLVVLSPNPHGGTPGDFVYVFSATLDCASGAFSGTDDSLCASIDGVLDPAGGSSGTLNIFALDFNTGACTTTVLCDSNWDDTPFNASVCDLDTCYLCEAAEGSAVPASPDASVSTQLRESPVLQRLRMGR